MKKCLMFICLFLILSCLTAVFLSVGAASDVVYIADGGTGDGSSPDKPLGHGSGYAAWSETAYAESAVNRAVDKLKSTGGTVVFVGPVTLRWGKTQGSGVDEMPIGPSSGKTDKTITFTAKYGNVDYRETKQAMLVVERNMTNRLSIAMQCPSKWDNLTLRAIHETASCASPVNYSFYCNSYATSFGTGFATEAILNGVALDYREAANADFFPLLGGGHRYKNQTGNPNLLVNGGKWQYVCGGCIGFNYGESDNKYGLLTGSTNVTFGGYARTIEGIGGGSYKSGGRITGNATIKITGGTIYGNVDLGGIGGFSTQNSTASLTVTGGNFDNTIAINDVSGAAGWYPPKSATVDCSSASQQKAEQLLKLVTYVDSFKMPDGSVHTFSVADDSLHESIVKALRSTPYTCNQYQEIYRSIMNGDKKYNVVNLLKMLAAKPTNGVEGLNVPANTDIVRENTIAYFDLMSQIEWTPKVEMDYTTATAYTNKLIYTPGQIYTGMPYSSIRKPSASIIEFLPYLDANKTYIGPTEYRYLIGIDCGAPRISWAYGGALVNAGIYASDFNMMINYNAKTNTVLATVGEYNTDGYTGSYDINHYASFDRICAPNGTEVMYEAYAKVRPCDFVCSRFFIGDKTTTDQHIRMAVEDAAVFRNGNGVISGSKSYLTLSEQTSTIYDVNGKKTTWQLNKKFTFNALYNGGYIPLTLQSLKNETVEKPTFSFDKKGYATGINLVGRGAVSSNYVLFAVNAVVTNASGKVVASAVAYPYSLSLTLNNTSNIVTTPSGGTGPDSSRDQGMSTLNQTVQSLPSGTYTYKLTATIGFGTKTITEFTFQK